MSVHRSISRSIRFWGVGALLALSAPSQAGSVYLEQVISVAGSAGQPGRESTLKIWLAKGMFRMDPGSGKVMIFRRDLGKFYQLDTNGKTYTEACFAAGAAMAAVATSADARVEMKTTGRTEKIGNWNAHEVALAITGSRPTQVSLWMSDDIGVDLKDWADVAGMLGMRALSGAEASLATLKGYPVRQEIVIERGGSKYNSTVTVSKAEERPADISLFTPPADFKGTETAPPAAASR